MSKRELKPENGVIFYVDPDWMKYVVEEFVKEDMDTYGLNEDSLEDKIDDAFYDPDDKMVLDILHEAFEDIENSKIETSDPLAEKVIQGLLKLQKQADKFPAHHLKVGLIRDYGLFGTDAISGVFRVNFFGENVGEYLKLYTASSIIAAITKAYDFAKNDD